MKLNESIFAKLKESENNILDKIMAAVEAEYSDGFPYEFDIDYDENEIYVYVEWGDWKHDHLRLDGIVQRVIDGMGIYHIADNTATEENGSDCYSSTHSYQIDPSKSNTERPKSEYDEYKENMEKFIANL